MYKFQYHAPQFIVHNLSDTVDYYRVKLSFKVDWIGEPPLFAIISRDFTRIMLRQLNKSLQVRPNKIPFVDSGWSEDKVGCWDMYIWIENADDLYKILLEKQVKIIREIADTDYGNRDFEIEDLNGYIICFGHVKK